MLYEVITLITAYAEVEKAVEAMRLGAFTYLAKPFSNQQLLASVTKAIEHYGLVREIRRLRAEATPRSGFGGMIGKSPSMRAVRITSYNVCYTKLLRLLSPVD